MDGAYVEPSGRADALMAVMRLALFTNQRRARAVGLPLRLADPNASPETLAEDFYRQTGVAISRQAKRDRLVNAAKYLPSLKSLLLPRPEGSLIERKAARGGRPTHHNQPANRSAVYRGST